MGMVSRQRPSHHAEGRNIQGDSLTRNTGCRRQEIVADTVWSQRAVTT